MAIKLITTIQRWQGLSTDSKPTASSEGSIFDELDTGRVFKWVDNVWIEDFSEPLTTGKAHEYNNESRRIMEKILLEVKAANRVNGIKVQ